jgi:hypothetical protein
MAIDRTKITKGMFMTGGPPADLTLTKVFAVKSVEDLEAVDREFNEAERLHEALAKTKKAIEALRNPN